MKVTINKPTEITVTHIKLILPVRYEEEQIPNDFPLRSKDTWEAIVNIDTGQILDWPKHPRFQECVLHLKVCDSGTYVLYSHLGDHWDEIARIDENYVPLDVVPGEYGDYVILKIKNGWITNWPNKPDVSGFFHDGGCNCDCPPCRCCRDK